MRKPKDSRFAEKGGREHDSVPVKRDSKTIVSKPRMTERDALRLAAYGELEDRTREEVELEMVASGKWAYCNRCSELLPATKEYFRADSRYARGIQHLCKKCNRQLSRRAMAAGRNVAMWRRKFRDE